MYVSSRQGQCLTYDAVSNVLSVVNGASVPQSGKAGGQMAHTYTYDALYRLVSATGIYTGADNKTASYTLAMGYDNMHRITSKRQILTQNNVQFNGTLNAGYDLSYTYGTDTGKRFQLANVKDVNYRTEETPSESENVNNNHAYEYDADGERTVKTSGESDQVYVNSEFAGGRTNTAKFSLYVSPYLVANQGGRYTKHIYIGSQRVVSKIGDFDSYGSDPRRIQYVGSETDGLSVDYKVKYTQRLQAIKDNYATFAVPYNGEDNNDYVDGKGFCCNDGSLEAAQTRALVRAAKNNFQEGDAYEKMQFYYHPDHLGSSSYITNLDGEVVQHIEYVPFGEVFVEERNNIWNTPYLFNAKEFDEETGLYYYGARYYDPRLSLWLSIDPKEEKYSNVSTYCYVISNPLKYTDPTGMEIDMTKVRLADEQLKLSTTQSVIKDLASQTGLQLSLDKDNKLQYAKNDEGKPIVNKITNKKGKEIDAGSKTARNFLIKMIDNKTEIEVSYHAKRTVTSGTQIGLSFEQISNMVKGAVGVDGNTLGFGMTFLHELHHTTIGGDYHDSTELFGTGPVVDNMNIIRNELNKQGFNYGERLNYKAIHTKEGNIIPFNESALTSLKYNSSMGKKAHYIKTK